MEDTLNNSNDLFLSFRKEMEDMSKKTKRLEKENETFRRKHDATNANIFRMAEEREGLKRRQDAAEKKGEKLMAIIRSMQQQGRKVPPTAAGVVEGYEGGGEAVEAEGFEGSEYSGDEEEEEDEEDDDEAAEEEAEPDAAGESEEEVVERGEKPRVFGPERPPLNPQSQAQPQAQAQQPQHQPQPQARVATNGH